MKKNQILQIVIHVLAWALVLASPFLIFWKRDEPDIRNKFLFHCLAVLSLMIVFYTNFFFLIGEYLFNKKILKFLLFNLIIILAISVTGHLWKEANTPDHADKIQEMNGKLPPPTFIFLFRDVLSLLMIAGLSVAIRITGKLYSIENQRKEEEKQRTRAELANLRQQLNPHFLFNTLNNIYALIETSPAQAQEVVLELSKLLRYVLYEDKNSFVPLQNEINFIRYYVELMRIRLPDKVDITIEDKTENSNYFIAPMLFITLVENAFKHGLSPVSNSFIHISFITDTTGKILTCTVHNSFFPKDKNDKSGSGIGLENLKRRMELLYPGQSEFHTGKIDHMFYSKITIPLYQTENA